MKIHLRERARGRHVLVTVFVGRDLEHMARAGRLIFDADTWPHLAAVLSNGCPHVISRDPCADCGHGGHVGEDCLVALADGEQHLFCACPDRAREVPAQQEATR